MAGMDEVARRDLNGSLAAALQHLKRDGLYRTRRTMETAAGPRVIVDGRECLSFCSNDYLGLANHPEVVAAFRRGAAQYGVGSAASHLICGHSAAHHALEEELADFVGRESALLFSTGYMANLGVVSTLCGRGDTVLEDRLNHASLLDAAILSRSRLRRYAHGDAQDLERRLVLSGEGRVLVVSDGVFSMDGDLAPLPQLAAAAGRHGGWLMVDDAHGLGVVGPNGAGTLEQFGLDENQVPVLMGTLGKAFGVFGAFVAGSRVLIDSLIQLARSYIYTTALPPAVAEAARASLRLIREESWRRERLRALVRRFREGAAGLGLPLLESETPIQPLLARDPERALRLSAALLERDILVGAIRPPTVPAGGARLRITLSAAHSEADLELLLEALGELV